MKAPKIKFKQDLSFEPYIDGDFEFKISENAIYSPTDFSPVKEITFGWCPDVPQNELLVYGEGKIIELISDKLKNDFINFIKNGTTDTEENN